MMSDYSRSLGNAVKLARGRRGISQRELADAANIDPQTVLKIENYKGNPTLEVLYALVRTLDIDSREIFYPEIGRDSPALDQFRLMIECCGEHEAEMIVPILQAVLKVIRANDLVTIE